MERISQRIRILQVAPLRARVPLLQRWTLLLQIPLIRPQCAGLTGGAQDGRRGGEGGGSSLARLERLREGGRVKERGLGGLGGSGRWRRLVASGRRSGHGTRQLWKDMELKINKLFHGGKI